MLYDLGGLERRPNIACGGLARNYLLPVVLCSPSWLKRVVETVVSQLRRLPVVPVWYLEVPPCRKGKEEN